MSNIHGTSEDRKKILIHSRSRFHKEGFYKISMDELASDLHVSKKTIYKYFPSKEKLLEEICKETTCSVNSSIEHIMSGNENVVIKFVKLLNMHGSFTNNISDKWLRDLSLHAPKFRKEMDELKNRQINKVLRSLVEQGKKEKLIRNYPTPIIINAFVSALTSVMDHEFLINNKFSLQNAFQITYELLLGGILTKAGKEKFSKTRASLAKEFKL